MTMGRKKMVLPVELKGYGVDPHGVGGEVVDREVVGHLVLLKQEELTQICVNENREQINLTLG